MRLNRHKAFPHLTQPDKARAMTLMIDITKQSESWPECSDLAARAIKAAANQLENPRTGELSLVLSDDAQVQILNRTYRNKDKPTNVLSFPQTGSLLGDIVLAFETVNREAEDKKTSLENHLTHLIIHGWLHLQSFDHQTDETAAEMESIEIAALATLGIDNPYQVSDD